MGQQMAYDKVKLISMLRRTIYFMDRQILEASRNVANHDRDHFSLELLYFQCHIINDLLNPLLG